MKTNVILESTSRDLLGTTIRQRTKDSFLCLSDLQIAYNKAREEFGWVDRDISNIMSTDSMKERIFELLLALDIINEEKLTIVNNKNTEKIERTDNQVLIDFEQFTIIKPRNHGSMINENNSSKNTNINPLLYKFKEVLDKQGIINTYKSLGLWDMKGKGKDRTVFVDPYIFMAIALEMNPKIYARTVIWLSDTLIFNRLEAGSNYLPMNEAIDKKLGLSEYWKYAIEINKKVFGEHTYGIRQLASKDKLKEITKIETFLTSAIHLGLVKDEESLLNSIKNFK
jgi:hypothetical protein